MLAQIRASESVICSKVSPETKKLLEAFMAVGLSDFYYPRSLETNSWGLYFIISLFY